MQQIGKKELETKFLISDCPFGRRTRSHSNIWIVGDNNCQKQCIYFNEVLEDNENEIIIDCKYKKKL